MMRSLLVSMMVAVAVPAGAQVLSRPTDPPIVTAANESWFRLREPIQLAGDLYFQAGAVVFFDRNTMVRTGHYNGVPLYANTTLEPFSVVLVPISRGLMQPYERLRQGSLGGTTGSRPPSFPVQPPPAQTPFPSAAGPPTAPPQPLGAIGVFSPEPPRAADVGLPMATMAPLPPLASYGLETSLPPESNDGLWVPFGGERWISDGMAVAFDASAFVQVGEHAGFPVFARAGLRDEVIYLPTRDAVVAPYRLAVQP